MRIYPLAAIAALSISLLGAADGPPKQPEKPAAPASKTTAPKPDATPKPLPVEEQEKLSRMMIRLQGAELEAFQVRSQDQIDGLQLHAAETKARRLASAYQDAVTALGAKYNCAGCQLDVDKNWILPPVSRQTGKQP